VGQGVTVKRYADVVNMDEVEEMVGRLTTKYCFGMDVIFHVWVAGAQITASTPTGNVIYPGPMLHIGFSTKSPVLGEWLGALTVADMIPQEVHLARGIQEAMNNLRTLRAKVGAVTNGQEPQGPTQSIKDRPQA
jgi:hypothetical protein